MLQAKVRGMAVAQRLVVTLALLSHTDLRAANLLFEGVLTRIGSGSISVRVDDGRYIDAQLAPRFVHGSNAIGKRYKTGDPVRIACKAIQRVWEAETSRFQFLEVVKIQSAPLSSPQAASRPPDSMEQDQDVKFRPGPPDARLENARKVNLALVAKMPDFVAEEDATRYTGDAGSARWDRMDTIQTEITVKGTHPVRQRIVRDGKPWNGPFERLPGFKWYDFGTEIKPVFDPKCPTKLKYDGPAQVNGKPTGEYEFSSPADGCFTSFYFEYQRYNPARTGHVFIDDPGGRVVQMDEQAIDFPAQFELAQRKEELSFDEVKIGDTSALLPVRANFVVLYYSGKRWRVDVGYKNYRRFEAPANIKFP